MPTQAVRRLLIAALVAPASALGAGMLLTWLSERVLAEREFTLGLHGLLPTLGMAGRPFVFSLATVGLILAGAVAAVTRNGSSRAPGFAPTAGYLLAGQALFFVGQALVVGGSGAFIDDLPTLVATGVLEVLGAAAFTALLWCLSRRIARFVAGSSPAERLAAHVTPPSAPRHTDPFCPPAGLLNQSPRRGPPLRLLLAR